MILAPMDDPLEGPIGAAQFLATSMAEEYLETSADVGTLLEETLQVLQSVDLTTSAPCRLDGDPDFEQMKRAWAFVGPSLCKKIEGAKTLVSRPLSGSSKRSVYALVANIQAFLFIRRQTLELNGLEVLKSPAA